MTDKKRIIDEKQRALDAINAAGFDVWENNFVTGETYGTNRQLFISLGYDEDELPCNLQETFDKIHPDDLANALESVKLHTNGDIDRYRSEMRIKAKDGSWVWIGSYGQILERDENNEVSRFVGITFNIDQRRILEESMKTMAYTDPLTNLGNRRILYESGNHEIERAKRYNHPISLMILDLDNFKQINDHYGHIQGDKILKKVADSMLGTIRQVDLKIRYGGDEFIILLLETDATEALETAERLRKSVETLQLDIPEHITISVGIAQLKADEQLESILKRGDDALYQAKRSGRNQVALHKN